MKNKLVIIGAIAALSSLAAVASASAYESWATSAVNVRSGPGPSYGVVGHLYAGEEVDVTACQSGWCSVESSGPSGWVSSGFLEQRIRHRYRHFGFGLFPHSHDPHSGGHGIGLHPHDPGHGIPGHDIPGHGDGGTPGGIPQHPGGHPGGGHPGDGENPGGGHPGGGDGGGGHGGGGHK